MARYSISKLITYSQAWRCSAQSAVLYYLRLSEGAIRPAAGLANSAWINRILHTLLRRPRAALFDGLVLAKILKQTAMRVDLAFCSLYSRH